MAALELHFLGGFEVAHWGERVTGFESDKARGLLAYLAIEVQRPQRREFLAGLLWPEFTEQAARGNLRRVLANVRDVIGDKKSEPPFLIITRQSTRFNQEADFALDAAVLESALSAAQQHSSSTTELETALAAYHGDFLAGLSVPDSAPFEQWLLLQRERYRQLVLEGFDLLVNRFEARGSRQAALHAARRKLAIEPTREEAHRQVMRLLAMIGDRSGALAQYEICRAVLEEELAVVPDQATTALYEQIRDGSLEQAGSAPWGESLRGYELREQIGSGAFGIVHRAYQPVVDRQVAIKVIRPEFANRPDFVRRFEAEAHLVARLDHLHIVPLYDYWREPDGAFLVMRWLRGGNLQQALGDGPWFPQQVSVLLDQIAGALAYAHQRGVIHGDVRAENILLDEQGNAYLSDFGIARDLMQPLPIPQTETLSGSVVAISPEQVLGSPASPLSDLYCLGLVLYQLLAGRSPLAGKTPEEQAAFVGHSLPSLTAEFPNLPPDLDEILQRATARDPLDRYEDVHSLAAAFRGVVGTVVESSTVGDAEEGVPANPYKGLRPFLETDAADFFGREALVQHLIARLNGNGEKVRLLAVIGPSGSGKSSLVNAGLIPALRRDALPDSGHWFVAEMVPGVRPLNELEMALRQVAVSWPAAADEQLRANDLGLQNIVRQLLPEENSQLLLVVDQFEELYTRAEDAVEVNQFLRLLAAAVEAEDSSVRVIVTLRADFYDRPLLQRQFSRILREGTEVVLPMSRAELLDAVCRPAARAGVQFAPGVAEGIVEEVRQQPGMLPVLQYALTEMFTEQQDRRITWEAYRTIGGVAGALALRAEGVYAALDQKAQITARQIFLRLVALGEGSEGIAAPDTRRRVWRVELQELARADANEEGATTVDAVLEAFGNHRLLTFDRDPVTRTPTVEIAHEALLREWPRLSAWLEENRDDLRLQRRLAAATAEWIAANRSAGLLASETRLAQYVVLASGDTLVLTADEAAFIAASAAAELARQQQAQRTRSLLRSLGIGAGVAAVVAIILALLAFSARSSALREAEVNRSLVIAANATEAMEAGESDRALALALEAVSIDDPPAEAVSKLASVAYGQGTRAVLTGHSAAVRSATFSPDDQEVLSGSCAQVSDDGDCSAGELIRWDLADGSEVARWPAHEDWVTAVAWHPDGTRALSGGGDGSLIIWDMASNTALTELQAHEGAINKIVLNPDSTMAALASDDGTISLVDAATGERLQLFVGHEGPVLDAAFSPDGQQLLSGAADALIILWDVNEGTVIREFKGHGSKVIGVAFMQDGAAILSGSYDLSFRLWDAVSGELLQVRETGDFAEGMALSPDGHTMLHYVTHVVYAWDANQFDGPHQKLYGHDGQIYDLSYSSDGQLALSTGEDKTVRVWALGGSDELQIVPLGYPATAAAAAPDGKTLAVGGWDQGAQVLDIETQTVLRSLPGVRGIIAPGSLTISADGRYAAAASGNYDESGDVNSLLVWDLATGELLCDLVGHTASPRTVAFGPDSTILLSGSTEAEKDGAMIQWDVTTCSMVRRLPAEVDVVGIDVSADGRTALSSSNAGQMTLWDLETGEATRTFELPGDVLLDGVFGPNDETVLAAALSGLIVQWDPQTGAEVNRFVGHDGGVWAIELSHDGRMLASSDDTGLVILWDAASGDELRRHHAHEALSFDVAFSPDDQTLYSVSADETLASLADRGSFTARIAAVDRRQPLCARTDL